MHLINEFYFPERWRVAPKPNIRIFSESDFLPFLDMWQDFVLPLEDRACIRGLRFRQVGALVSVAVWELWSLIPVDASAAGGVL